ncbi:hypothetical protein HN873_040493, partial [Arachis hypogaea]
NPKLPAPSLPFLPPSTTIHQGQQRHRRPSSRDQIPERSSVATQQRSSVATRHPAALVISHRNHCTAAATTTALRPPPPRPARRARLSFAGKTDFLSSPVLFEHAS